MRYLAIDPGKKRTGLAVGDDDTGVVNPLAVIQASSQEERLRQIGQAVDEYKPDALVVGLPLNMDGTEGPAAAAARELAAILAQRFGLAVHLVDERLSSYDADQQLSGLGLTHRDKRLRRDAMAAAVILRTFLESR